MIDAAGANRRCETRERLRERWQQLPSQARRRRDPGKAGGGCRSRGWLSAGSGAFLGVQMNFSSVSQPSRLGPVPCPPSGEVGRARRKSLLLSVLKELMAADGSFRRNEIYINHT